MEITLDPAPVRPRLIAQGSVVPEALRLARVGTRTMVRGLDDQIRFRVEGTGPVSGRAFVPDTPLTADLVRSPAGSDVIHQLQVAARGADQQWEQTDLRGFVLPSDGDSAAASTILQGVRNHDPDLRSVEKALGAGDIAGIDRAIAGYRSQFDQPLSRFSSWYQDGWVTFNPETALMILANAGAYRPAPDELAANPKTAVHRITGTGVHEVQHAVQPVSDAAYRDPALRWIEEGAANVLSRTPAILQRSARAMRVTPASYAARLGQQLTFDPGWAAWTKPARTAQAQAIANAQTTRDYIDAASVLRDLVKLGGADFGSNAGIAQARVLLRGHSIRDTPSAIADAIIGHQHLDPAVREPLVQRIATAVDQPGAVAAIRRDFGIGRAHRSEV